MGAHQKDLDKSILYPRNPSPCQGGRNHLDPMSKKTRPHHKDLNKPIPNPKNPSPCPRGLNHLHMLRKPNAQRSKRVMLCPKVFLCLGKCTCKLQKSLSNLGKNFNTLGANLVNL